MAFDPPTNFGYVLDATLVPLDSGAAEKITDSSPIHKAYAIGHRLYGLEQGKVSGDAALSVATAGSVAYVTISLATLPLAGSIYEIGRDTYEIVAATGSVSDDAFIAVEANADKDIVGARLAAAINATNVRNQHRTVFRDDGETPALANGTEAVFAAYVASTDTLWVFAAEEVGGAIVDGTAPDLAVDAAATGSPSWSAANLNASPGAGHKYTNVWRERLVITAGMVSAGTHVFVLPFYSATYGAQVTAYAAANVNKGTPKAVTGAVALTAGPGDTGLLTLTIGDIIATDVVFIEVWA